MKISLKKPDGSCCCGSRYHIVGGCLCRDPCDTENTEELEPCSDPDALSINPGSIYIYEKSQIPTGCCGYYETRAVILDDGGFSSEAEARAELEAKYTEYTKRLASSCDHLELTLEYGILFTTDLRLYHSYRLPYSPYDDMYAFNRREPFGSETIILGKDYLGDFIYEADAGKQEGILGADCSSTPSRVNVHIKMPMRPPTEWLNWLSSDGVSVTTPEGYRLDPAAETPSVYWGGEYTFDGSLEAGTIARFPDCDMRWFELGWDNLIPCGTAQTTIFGSQYPGTYCCVRGTFGVSRQWLEEHGQCITSIPEGDGEYTSYMYSDWFQIDVAPYVYGTVRYVRNEV